jgi:hypothetical protein
MTNPLAAWRGLQDSLAEYALLMPPRPENDIRTFWQNEAWLHRERAESLERELEECQEYAAQLERQLAEDD